MWRWPLVALVFAISVWCTESVPPEMRLGLAHWSEGDAGWTILLLLLDTRMVVLETEIDSEPTVIGIVADKVHEVTDIEAASVESAPRVGMRWRPEFVAGIGKRNGDFIIIPDLARIFDIEGRRSAPGATERVA